jgi:hypothetical protein
MKPQYMPTHPDDVAFPADSDSIMGNPRGLTKREYFASMALQSVLGRRTEIDADLRADCERAVEATDMMIEILNQ